MAQILGMNPQEVRDLARQLEQAAGEIDQIKTRLSSKLASTTWTGPDADRPPHRRCRRRPVPRP